MFDFGFAHHIPWSDVGFPALLPGLAAFLKERRNEWNNQIKIKHTRTTDGAISSRQRREGGDKNREPETTKKKKKRTKGAEWGGVCEGCMALSFHPSRKFRSMKTFSSSSSSSTRAGQLWNVKTKGWEAHLGGEAHCQPLSRSAPGCLKGFLSQMITRPSYRM